MSAGDQPERRPGAVEADVEAAVGDRGVGERALDGLGRAGRQARVGVEEQEDVAAGRPGRAGVHLARPAAAARHETHARGPGGDLRASVLASAVRDDHLGAGARRGRAPPAGSPRWRASSRTGTTIDSLMVATRPVRGEEVPGGPAPAREPAGASETRTIRTAAAASVHAIRAGLPPPESAPPASVKAMVAGQDATRRHADVRPEGDPRQAVREVLEVEREERDQARDHQDAPAVALDGGVDPREPRARRPSSASTVPRAR